MTGLIIRDAYFPDSSRFAEVPPKFVFELFLNEAAAFNNTLHLYHEKEKTGHANFVIRRLPGDANPPVYSLVSNGSISLPSDGEPKMDTGFSIRAELENAESWRGFELDTNNTATKTNARIKWKRGDAFPDIEIKRGGEVVMNSQMAQMMMALQGGGQTTMGGSGMDLLAQLGKSGAGGQDLAAAMRLHAREGVMDLAGKQRRCYIITTGLPGVYEVKIYFTEVGELARIELPEGYRLLEPMMHGLEPDLNTVE